MTCYVETVIELECVPFVIKVLLNTCFKIRSRQRLRVSERNKGFLE